MASSDTRVFVGRIGYDVRQRDIEDLFSKYGKIVNCSLKTTYGFVEFEDPVDAKEAVKGLDGEKLLDSTLVVEFSHGTRRGGRGDDRGRERGDRYSRDDRDRYKDDRYSRDDRDRDRDRDRGHDRDRYERRSSRRGSGKYSPPYNTDYRISVTNLPSGCSWQDLKDHFRKAGEVCFSDVRRDRDGREYGIVEFKHYDDMKEAVSKFDRTKMKDNTINVFIEYDKDKKNDRRSPSPSRKRSRSKSRGGSPSPKRARENEPAKSDDRREPSPAPTEAEPPRKSPSPQPKDDDD